MGGKKRGPASLEEEKFIRENYESIDVPEIARILNRTEIFVKERIAQIPVIQEKMDREDEVSRLHKSHFWEEVKRTLMPNEVGFFEQQWVKLVDQFSTNEILPTDEMMIKDLIILEIGGLRANTEKRKALIMIQELEHKMDLERVLPDDQQDKALMALINTQISSLRTALPALSKEHLEYQQRKDQKLRDLKATRDLRFKHIEESKKNIFELIKDLDSLDKRKKEGRWMELMKMGADKIEADWQHSMKFEDGSYNSPFLSPEGVSRNE